MPRASLFGFPLLRTPKSEPEPHIRAACVASPNPAHEKSEHPILNAQGLLMSLKNCQSVSMYPVSVTLFVTAGYQKKKNLHQRSTSPRLSGGPHNTRQCCPGGQRSLRTQTAHKTHKPTQVALGAPSTLNTTRNLWITRYLAAASLAWTWAMATSPSARHRRKVASCEY